MQDQLDFDAAPTVASTADLASLPDPTEPHAGQVGAHHPDTSVLAAQLVAPRAASQRGRILDALLLRERRGAEAEESGRGYLPPVGFTAAELAGMMNISRNQVGARVLELRQDGWLDWLIVDGLSVTRATEGRFVGRVSVLTEQGRREWSERTGT